MKQLIILSLLLFTACARALVCPVFWPFGIGPIGGLFGWIIFIGVIILVVYLIINSTKQKQKSDEDTPLAILEKRYAKGEITKEEYKKNKQELEE